MKVTEIIFSPTGGTQKVSRIVGEHLSGEISTIDLCAANKDFSEYVIPEDSLVLISMPSYGGRIPAVASERLKSISGNGARCVLICVYGNRAYEDTLAEMEDAAKECGFRVVGAIAAVAEHSIARKYAASRPDASDKKQLEEFADRIASKTELASSIPGNRPFKQSGGGPGMAPAAGDACVRCGACARNCPVQAIDKDTLESDPNKCFSCMRCVKVCPKKTRNIAAERLEAISAALGKVCSDRKENELFL